MEDYSVLEAADAAQCRNMLSNNDVDLVILDIMLPDGDGISLCREIKAKRYSDTVPVRTQRKR